MNFLSRGNFSNRGSKKRVNVPDILPTDSTSNPPPTGVPITNGGTNDSDDDSFPRTASESKGDTDLGVPPYFPLEGFSVLPEEATSPCPHGQFPAKQYPHD